MNYLFTTAPVYDTVIKLGLPVERLVEAQFIEDILSDVDLASCRWALQDATHYSRLTNSPLFDSLTNLENITPFIFNYDAKAEAVIEAEDGGAWYSTDLQRMNRERNRVKSQSQRHPKIQDVILLGDKTLLFVLSTVQQDDSQFYHIEHETVFNTAFGFTAREKTLKLLSRMIGSNDMLALPLHRAHLLIS